MEEQFNAFVTGFNELIPPDLVNVFDERELELLIGGIADIDVEDWKKHTDYRGYTEQDQVIRNFWTVSNGFLPPEGVWLMRLFSVSEAGTQSRSLDYCNSQPAPLVYRSTALKICKEVMGPEGSQSRNRARTKRYRNPIHGKGDEHARHPCLFRPILTLHAVSTAWICRTIRPMKIFPGSSPSQSRRL